MRLYWSIALILLATVFHCSSNVLAKYATGVGSQSKIQSSRDNYRKAILTLTDQAYTAYEQENLVESRKLFAEAAARLEEYIKKYETNPASLSYLQLQTRLGALYQNADLLGQARIIFERCEQHKKFNSSQAVLKVMLQGKKVKISIANYVKAQLCFLLAQAEKCRDSTIYSRVVINGSSRGTEMAPRILNPNL